MEKYMRERKEKGLCMRCGKVPHSPGRVNCDSCRKLASEAAQKTAHDRKGSGRCVNCGRPRSWSQYYCDVCRSHKSGKNLENYHKRRKREGKSSE